MDFQKIVLEDTKVTAKLTIEPLAPLSMVAVLPGSYYRSLRQPTKHMICGLLENLMNLHYNPKLRNVLLKQLSKILKKQGKDFHKDEAVSYSGYTSLLYPFIHIELGVEQPVKSFDDLWTQHLKHNDKRHVDGVRNSDGRVYHEIQRLKKHYHQKIKAAADKKEQDKLQSELSSKIAELKIHLLKESHFPNFYQSPKRREFIIPKYNFQYRVSMNRTLFNAAKEATDENNIGYLGTNEGWVNVEIEKL